MLCANWVEQVCKEAETWLGTPYHANARVKGVGVDCGGLIYQIYNPHFGPFAPYPEHTAVDWALHKDEERYIDFIMPYVAEIPEKKIGGITLFKVVLAYSHAAIYIGNNKYIHAWGRPHHGSVVKTDARVMNAMAKHGIKHYFPKGG